MITSPIEVNVPFWGGWVRVVGYHFWGEFFYRHKHKQGLQITNDTHLSSGAPSSVCSSLTPGHGQQSLPLENIPYSLQVISCFFIHSRDGWPSILHFHSVHSKYVHRKLYLSILSRNSKSNESLRQELFTY